MTKKIPLTQGKFALVDDANFEYLSQFSWRYHNGYAARTTSRKSAKRTTVLMHRDVLSTDKEVDHINGNRLDNTRSNLREATREENCRNVRKHSRGNAPYKGINYDARRGKWRARIRFDGKEYWLGYFNNPHDAARMYNFWAVDLFGEFAKLNVIKEAV